MNCDKDIQKIYYLTVMIENWDWKINAGWWRRQKKTRILFGGETASETRACDGKKVPYIRLVDTVWIDLSDGFCSVLVGVERNDFIDNLITLKKVNDFVYILRNYISSNRFVVLVNNSINMVESNIFDKYNKTKKFQNVIFIIDLIF